MSDNLILNSKKAPVSDEMLLRSMVELSRRLDAVTAQMYNASLVIEFVMNMMNEFKLPDGSTPLAIDVAALDEFGRRRTEELQEEAKEQMAAYLAATNKQTLDLNE